MYSAGTGQGALDRLGDDDQSANSVYTRTLLPLLMTPGLSLSDIARKVKGGVRDLAGKAGHEQTPAYYDEIVGDFYPAGEHSSVDKGMQRHSSRLDYKRKKLSAHGSG